MDLLRAMTKEKDWHVALEDEVLAGPFRTRREARTWAFSHAKAAGDPEPWGELSPRDPDYPSFYTLHTANFVFYIGLASALGDQNDFWQKQLAERASR